MVMSAGMCSTIFADQVTITGNLTYKTTESYTPASITVPANCDGGSRTITFATQTSDKYVPYAYNAGTNIKFEVHSQKPGAINPVYTKNTAMSTINYDQTAPLDGSFSHTLNDAAIAPSRYNYTCKVYVGSETSPAFEKDFNISSSGAVFPIGSVIAYMGNSTTIAALAESGWYKCAGQTVTSLSALTADEKTALTNIVGSTLPDLRGAFLRGLDENRGWDDDRATRTGGEGGNGVGSYEGDLIGSHTHTGTTSTDGNHTHSWNYGWEGDDDNHGGSYDEFTYAPGPNWASPIGYAGNHSHTLNINSTGGAETRPENVAVYWLIRCR